MSLSNQYIAINNSFEKTLVFHIGADSGFFSEYNNMLIAMVYCLVNKIRFTIYSNDANFGFDKGWEDYFLPFCEEKQERFHHYFNFRQPLPSWKELIQRIWKKKKIAGIQKQIRYTFYIVFKKYFQKRYRFDYLTYELWPLFYNRQNEADTYDIPELGIQGTLQEACKVMTQLTWRWNDSMKHGMEQTVSRLNLPLVYTGLQIRGGDKVIEADTIPVQKYIDRLIQTGISENIFVLTDHYENVQTLLETGNWNVFTLCRPDAAGYVHQRFAKQDKENIKNNITHLLCSADILIKSTHFIGTYTANPSIFVGIIRPDISEDIENRPLLLIDFLKMKI